VRVSSSPRIANRRGRSENVVSPLPGHRNNKGVTKDRWHHSQSDARFGIIECALLMALERFWREEGRSLIGFLGRNISSQRSFSYLIEL
jgi:hypothetical protein